MRLAELRKYAECCRSLGTVAKNFREAVVEQAWAATFVEGAPARVAQVPSMLDGGSHEVMLLIIDNVDGGRRRIMPSAKNDHVWERHLANGQWRRVHVLGGTGTVQLVETPLENGRIPNLIYESGWKDLNLKSPLVMFDGFSCLLITS